MGHKKFGPSGASAQPQAFWLSLIARDGANVGKAP